MPYSYKHIAKLVADILYNYRAINNKVHLPNVQTK